MSASKRLERLGPDELFWTDWRAQDPSDNVGLPQLGETITPTTTSRDDPEEVRYIHDRLNRIRRVGWKLHVPSEVSRMRSQFGEFSRRADQRFRDEVSVRKERIERMTQYVAENPLFAVVTDLGTGTNLYEQHKHAGKIREFVLRRRGDNLIIEPVVEGPQGKAGLLPQMLVDGQPYKIRD